MGEINRQVRLTMFIFSATFIAGKNFGHEQLQLSLEQTNKQTIREGFQAFLVIINKKSRSYEILS